MDEKTIKGMEYVYWAAYNKGKQDEKTGKGMKPEDHLKFILKQVEMVISLPNC